VNSVLNDWETRKLKFVATCNDDALSETTDPEFEMEYVDISSVNLVEGVAATETVTFDKAPSRARRIVQDGDTIISTVRTYLKAIASIQSPPANMVVSTGFAVIRPTDAIDGGFLGYALQNTAFIELVVANSTGVSYPAINPSLLTSLPIAFPRSLATQKQIAAFLDWKTSQIDALIAKKQTLLQKLKEKRLAVITQAVTKGLNPDAPMRDSRIAWLGEVPAHWKLPALALRYKVELGKMLDEKQITKRHLIPYLRNVDVQWGKINFEDLPEMDIAPHEYSRYAIEEGDVLVCEGGEVGRAAIVGSQTSVFGFQKALHRLRAPTAEESPQFIFYTMMWAANTGVFNEEGNSTIAHLTAEKLRRYRFPQPPLAEQAAIVEQLGIATEQIRRLLDKAESAITRLTEYRSALITAATTGKIDVRGWQNPAM
jgi:type I restriction enzyme S subunit